RRSPKVCFTVISKHELVAEAFQMRYESVIVFGTIRVIEDPEEKKEAMRRLVASYISGYEKETDEHCVKTEKALAMFEITPEHITGKAGT
ncbi:MAG: pyridoxamine 5'-phosphate oxidase family protein, partial [Anaerovoracaceae bacterium]|nr:pyridoxamine 5'-phosphate oxidase family protein [Anaerovoracaceae bacterium]